MKKTATNRQRSKSAETFEILLKIAMFLPPVDVIASAGREAFENGNAVANAVSQAAMSYRAIAIACMSARQQDTRQDTEPRRVRRRKGKRR